MHSRMRCAHAAIFRQPPDAIVAEPDGKIRRGLARVGEAQQRQHAFRRVAPARQRRVDLDPHGGALVARTRPGSDARGARLRAGHRRVVRNPPRAGMRAVLRPGGPLDERRCVAPHRARASDAPRGRHPCPTPFQAHRLGVRLARATGVPTVESHHAYFEQCVAHYLPFRPLRCARRRAGCRASCATRSIISSYPARR